MKSLVVAYYYSSKQKSEGLAAYNLCTSLRALGHEITVLTEDNDHDEGVINMDAGAVSSDSGVGLTHNAGYFGFVGRCMKYARAHLHEFDIIHHVSPISLRFHNPLARLDRPFIWGPVGGSIPYPKGFEAVAARDPMLARLRALDPWRLRFDPFLVQTQSRAAAIVTTSRAAGELISPRHQHKVTVAPEGIARDELVAQPHANPGNYVFASGRLVPYKAFDLLIDAFSRLPEFDGVQLKITGVGPEEDRLEALIEARGQRHRIELLGKVPRSDNLKLMRECLFCVLPALNEAFGGSNIEAFASAKPLVVTDWGGPSDIVTDGVDGFKIAPHNPAQLTDDLFTRMELLLSDANRRAEMSRAALKSAERFLWPEIARTYDALYRTNLRTGR